MYVQPIPRNRLVLEEEAASVRWSVCTVCVHLPVCVCVCVCAHYRFSWLLNGIPAADTPRAKLWRRLYGLVTVFWQQFLKPQSSGAEISLQLLDTVI